MELFSALSRLNFKGVSNPNPEECGYCILEGYPIGYLCIGIHSWQLHTPQPSCSLARDLVAKRAIFCSKHQRQIGIHTGWIFIGFVFSRVPFQVGGFNPLENYAHHQIGSFPRGSGKKYKNIWNLTTTQFFPLPPKDVHTPGFPAASSPSLDNPYASRNEKAQAIYGISHGAPCGKRCVFGFCFGKVASCWLPSDI